MKRKKTQAPQADEAEIRDILEGLERLPPPSEPFDFADRTSTAQEAKRLYDRAAHLSHSFRYNEEAGRAYDIARERYGQAIIAAYPTGFAENLKRLRQGDPAGLPDIIAFLEADPFFFATGYLKEDLARWIRPEMLTSRDAARLRRVVLNIVDRRNHRDFGAFCRLACKLDAPDLRRELTQRMTDENADVRRRARWMLSAMEHTND